MPDPISPPPVRDWRPEYLPAYLSNGIIGIRATRLAFLGGSAILNGYAGKDPTTGIEGFARIPYPLAADIELHGVRTSAAPERLQFLEQRYDFARAELATDLRFEVDGSAATIHVLTACSQRLPTVVMQEILFEVNDETEVAISLGIDPTGVPGRPIGVTQPPVPAPTSGVDGTMRWLSVGEVAEAGLAYASQVDFEAERSTSPHDQNGMAATSYRVKARPNRTYCARQFAAAVPSLAHSEPYLEAARIVALAGHLGWARLRADDTDRWRELWRARIELDTDDSHWQEIADASLFYLLTSTHSSSPASTSLFGLAYWPNYHYYGGHVMWDIEAFAVPPLLLLNPPAARSLLDFRVRHLEAAKQNARLLGWAGAEYPWQASPLNGDEVTIGSTPPLEEHVGLDVALATARYAFATGDVAFLRQGAYAMLEQIAQWVMSRVTPTRRGHEILHTIGLAEARLEVDNEAYVNMAASVALREIARAARMIGYAPETVWQQVADSLPLARDGDVVLNHDGYKPDETQGSTPVAATGIWPVGYELPPEVETATLRYAVERQAPGYVGSAMMSSLLPVFAVRAGLADRAPELLQRGYLDFIDPPYRMTDEFPNTEPAKPRANPMFANLGGFLMTLIYGYTGLQLGPDEPAEWARRPVLLPPGWRGIHIERVWARQLPMSLEARAGMTRAELRPIKR